MQKVEDLARERGCNFIPLVTRTAKQNRFMRNWGIKLNLLCTVTKKIL